MQLASGCCNSIFPIVADNITNVCHETGLGECDAHTG